MHMPELEFRSRTVLEALKAETRTSHAALERRFGALTEPGLQLETYRGILLQLRGFVGPLEDGIADLGAWLDHGIDLGARRKADWLDADLHALGVSLAAHRPRCSTLPELHTRSAGFGCLYVLEGATLGGQLITRSVSGSVGLTPSRGLRYFSGYGPATASMWRSFQAALCAHALASGETLGLICAARDTFDCLLAWCADQQEAGNSDQACSSLIPTASSDTASRSTTVMRSPCKRRAVSKPMARCSSCGPSI